MIYLLYFVVAGAFWSFFFWSRREKPKSVEYVFLSLEHYNKLEADAGSWRRLKNGDNNARALHGNPESEETART